jgi:phosphoenolpyruvate carboxykinase (ATP)
VQRREGALGLGGAFVVNTGRIPAVRRDKYIVNEPGTKDTVWWGGINQPIDPARFDALQQRMLAYLQGRELFVHKMKGAARCRHYYRAWKEAGHETG